MIMERQRYVLCVCGRRAGVHSRAAPHTQHTHRGHKHHQAASSNKQALVFSALSACALSLFSNHTASTAQTKQSRIHKSFSHTFTRHNSEAPALLWGRRTLALATRATGGGLVVGFASGGGVPDRSGIGPLLRQHDDPGHLVVHADEPGRAWPARELVCEACNGWLQFEDDETGAITSERPVAPSG